jgi:capsular exopolysaccharide synthesis family protein
VAGLARDGARGTSLLVTGSNAQEGTTAVACGLAIAMAETGAKVALVDANMRTPGVGRYLALESNLGLADVLTGSATVREALQDSLDGRLTVLPPGERPVDPGEVLASPRLGATMRRLTERFDIVLVDAPPLHAVADAAVLGKVTDGALLVVRANHTPTLDVQRSVDLLERVGARVAGAVLNALPRKLPTGTAWHRDASSLGSANEPELVSHLFGDEDVDRADDDRMDDREDMADRDDMDDTMVNHPPVGPARGRARVVQATIVSEDEEPEEPARDGIAARGQARVVVITDAKPPVIQPPVIQPPVIQPPVIQPPADAVERRAETPNLPAQRRPDGDQRRPDASRPEPEEKQQSGE